jgi:hypothetical protein
MRPLNLKYLVKRLIRIKSFLGMLAEFLKQEKSMQLWELVEQVKPRYLMYWLVESIVKRKVKSMQIILNIITKILEILPIMLCKQMY